MRALVVCCAAALLLASCAASPLPDADVAVDGKLEAADGAAVAPSEPEVDAQIAGLIQQLEALQGLTPREKRAVNALLGGGGGGGSFLNELNKGPTYSQLLGNSGGGFGSKLGIFSSLLGSSSGASGGAGGAGGEAGGGGGSDSGSILGLITPLLGSSSGPLTSTLLNLGLVPNLDLPGGDAGDAAFPLAPSETMPDGEEDALGRSAAAEGAVEGTTISVGDLAGITDLTSSSGGGAGAGATAGASVSLDGLGGLGGGDGSDLGASAGASIDGDAGSSAGASAGAAGGSDSGSILGLITPLLGSSSQGSAGDGSASGGGSAGGSGGGFFGAILNSVISIKSFIFRKIIQLLGSSSGSPQAG